MIRRTDPGPITADETRPWKITFVLTETCNLRCRHCHCWIIDDRRVLPCSVILGAVAELNDWVGDYKLFLAGGEPTLRQDLEQIVAGAARGGAAGRGAMVSLQTNGVLINERRAEALVRGGLRHADIALDAVDPEVHDALRGRRGAHARAVAALDLLHRLRREHDSPLWLNVAAVIHGTNLDELPRLARWVADRGYGNLLLQPIVPPFWSNHDRDWLRRSPLWPHDPAHVAAVLDELIALRRDGHPIDNDEAQLRGMKHYFADGPLPRSADDTETAEASGEARPPALPRGAGRLRELTDDDATPLPPIDPARLPAGVHPTDRADRCLIGHKVLNINPRGEVRLCHDMPPVGNLRHQTLRQIWTSPRAAELRDHIARCHEPCYLLNCNWCD